MSIRSVVRVRSEKAVMTSYEDTVRSSGIWVPCAICPVPRGSRETYFAPRRVLIRTDAPVEGPKATSSVMRKSTRTWEPSRSTPVTSPTLTPAMRTSSPSRRPPASEKAAL